MNAEDSKALRDGTVDAVLGCIIGGAIGDAAGAAWEGVDRDSLSRPLVTLDWQLTDDTHLTLATCEALCESGTPDPACVAASFLRWFRARRLSRLGASTLKALRDLDVGAHWALSGRRDEQAAGNGAAMRIAPLAFCVDPLADGSRQVIRDISRITHHSDEAYAGALAVVLAVWAAKTGGQSLEWIASHLPDTSVRDRLLSYDVLPNDESIVGAGRRHGVSGHVVESVPFALYAACQVGRVGFASMLEQVIATGGDADTNASVACQVAGTSLGFERLPAELLQHLPQAELVFGIAQEFAKCVTRDA
jgi:ADP-ribosylglycohydrolase